MKHLGAGSFGMVKLCHKNTQQQAAGAAKDGGGKKRGGDKDRDSSRGRKGADNSDNVDKYAMKVGRFPG